MSAKISKHSTQLTQSINFKTAETLALKAIKGYGKTAAVQYKDGVLSYSPRDLEKKIPKNNKYALLCQIIYQYCRQGRKSMPTTLLYERAYNQSYDELPYDLWKKLHNRIGQANTWAKRKGFPMLFRCTKDKVYKLGTE